MFIRSKGVTTSAGVNPDFILLPLGSVELQIQLCDITKATTDAIVNSTDKEMDLASGMNHKLDKTCIGRPTGELRMYLEC